MYINKQHRFHDQKDVFSLIQSYPLGTWIYRGTDTMSANHIPFLLDRDRGPNGTLIGHVSRANNIWRELDAAIPSIIMFQGPQAYITPGWYPGKAEHGKVVPTWDYAVAHVHGTARVVDDRDWTLDMLNRLTDANEAGQAAPWRVSDAPSSYIDKLMRAIVGIEIPIDRIEGKLKASQDEAWQDRLGTVIGLQRMAGLVKEAVEADGRKELG